VIPIHHVQVAFAACAVLLLVMGGFGFVLYRRLLRGLRERHPAEWERLGRPTVIYYASQRDRRALGRWVAGGGFERLGDPAFASSCRRYRAYLRAYGWTFAALWLLFGAVLALRA
jgi:hypothetical protein